MCVYCACVVPTGSKQEAAGGGEKQDSYIILETNYHLTALHWSAVGGAAGYGRGLVVLGH